MKDPPQLQHNRAMFTSEGGRPPPRKKGADLKGFTPARAHLSLQRVYGYLPHHNDGEHLAGGVLDGATSKSC